MRTISWIGCTLSSGRRQLRVVGDLPADDIRRGQVDFLQAQTEVEMIALRRQAAIDRAGTDGDQHFAVAAKLAQHMHVLGIADAALDEADVARPAVLDVGQRRAVEIDALDKFEKPLVNVQQGHVTAEATGQRSSRQTQLALRYRGVHLSPHGPYRRRDAPPGFRPAWR
jgi:hypothetical protein